MAPELVDGGATGGRDGPLLAVVFPLADLRSFFCTRKQ